MQNYEKAFPSKYVKALDLEDGPQQATITKVVEQDVFDDLRLVAHLDSMKPLILNRVNADAIAELAGSKATDKWIGLRIELYADTTEYRGKRVPCVRVRRPLPLKDGANAPTQGRIAF